MAVCLVGFELASYVQRVLDQNAVNHFLHILKEEVACRHWNGNWSPGSTLAERGRDLIPTRQRRGRVEHRGTASRLMLHEVSGPDAQRYQAGTCGDHADGRGHHVVPEVEKGCRGNQIAGSHDAEAEADTEDPAAVSQAKFSRRNHQKEQEAEDEDALAAHHLSGHGKEELVSLTTRHK